MKMASIMIFAGTTEGRKIAEFLRGHAPKVYVLTATEYGKEQVENGENIHVLAGRLDVEGMRELAYGCQAELVIDATHPFAMEVTKNIQKMCQEESISYMRVLREGSVKDGNAVRVKNIREAADYLKDKEGNVLITTGSKELAPYTEIPDYQSRCFLRVLSTKEAVQKAVENGFEGKHLIAMQGPFSQEMNEQLLRHVQAKYMVTKESGRSGGYEEKLRAAKKAGAVAVVIGRPLEKGVTLDEAFQILAEKYGFRRPRHITLVGVGPGDESLLTKAAQRAMKSADVLIGAKRMLQAAEGIAAERYEEYRADKIEEFLRINSRYRQIVILLSGDVSFYSGAAKLKETLKEYEMSVIPGISSISCMAARIGKGVEHTPLLSIHGRNCNYVDYLREYGRIFLLVSSGKEIETVLRRLCRYGYGSASVYVGSRLSYPKENLISGTAKRLSEKEKIWDGLSVMYVEIPEILVEEAPQETEDGDFIRGKIPMTKSGIRSVVLAKMNPQKDAVIYDVGAGTGSVSIALAKKSIDGMVFAIEKKIEGIALIHKNKRHFHVSNIQAVHGEAPEALEQLPAPDLAFVGGSSGNLTSILEAIWSKNPEAKIVVSAITLNTLAECTEYIKRHPKLGADIMQIQVSQGKKVGRYQMMTGQNPIYIVTFERRKEKKEQGREGEKRE